MADELHAFFGDHHVGVFIRDGNQHFRFVYDSGHTGTPVSLSLPVHLPAASQAAAAYLDNLLPDREDVRARWARERGLSSVAPFTLLAEYGEVVVAGDHFARRSLDRSGCSALRPSGQP